MNLTSILKKLAMAVTGLGLFLFLVTHLSGNFLLLKSPPGQSFNAYSDYLHSLGLALRFAEGGLVILFLAHIYSGIRVALENRRARPARYTVTARRGEATLASRTMAIGGLILAAFVIIHVKTFTFGDTSGPGGLFGLVMRTFESPWIVAWYTVAMFALGLHLSHGFGSAFQTLGVVKTVGRLRLRKFGLALGWIMAIGFASLPWWSHFSHAGG